MIAAEQRERVRLVRLNHPPANVLTLELLAGLRREAAAAAADPGTRAVVLASDIPRYFSAGLDLRPESGREPFVRLIETYRAWLELPKPTVAAVSGSCILGGWIMAMAMDYRFLSPDGKIALSEVKYGLTPTRLLIGRALELSGDPRAVKELALRGRTLRADEALAAGFVDELAQDPLERALKEARALARCAPNAYASVKASLRGRWEDSLSEFEKLYDSPEGREGIAALTEKRRPRWEA